MKTEVVEKVITIQDLMKDNFLMNHYREIILFANNYSEKLGYTYVIVNKDLTVDSIDFKEGRFNRKKFSKVTVDYNLNPFNGKPIDAFNYYFIILYNDKTMIMFYRTYARVQTSKTESDYLNLNPLRSVIP